MLKKILSIKAEDWEKALSYETEAFVSGFFKVFSLANPFLRRGNMQPTPAAVQLGSGTISSSKTIRAITPFFSSTAKFYALADDSNLYAVDAAAGTVSDVSGQITATSGAATAIKPWKNGVLYIVNGQVEYNAIPVANGSKVPVMTTGAGNALSGTVTPICVGPDGYAYIGNGNNVAKVTNATGTASNSNSVAASLETGFTVRQLINDGRYLVWLADTSQGGGRNRCVVAYWDLAKSVFDQLYEFNDLKISSAEIVGDFIKIITPAGVYLTNAATRPRLVTPFGSTVAATQVPGTHNASCVHQGNFVVWGTGSGSSDKVFALGNKLAGQPDRIFQPYAVASSVVINALASDDINFLMATVVSSTVVLYRLPTDPTLTLNTAVANVASFTVPKPFTYNHTKVITRSPISAGNSVSVKVLNSASSKTVSASVTKTNSTDPGEKNLTFEASAAGDGSDVAAFDEISDIELTSNVPIRTLEVWADEADERSTHG